MGLKLLVILDKCAAARYKVFIQLWHCVVWAMPFPIVVNDEYELASDEEADQGWVASAVAHGLAAAAGLSPGQAEDPLQSSDAAVSSLPSTASAAEVVSGLLGRQGTSCGVALSPFRRISKSM